MNLRKLSAFPNQTQSGEALDWPNTQPAGGSGAFPQRPPAPFFPNPARLETAVDRQDREAGSESGSPVGDRGRRALELVSLSLRGLSSIMYPLSYPLRRLVLRQALKDALGDRRLAFVLFCKTLEQHPTTPASIRSIFWAHNRLALAPSETPTPSITGWDGTQAQTPRGAGSSRPAPQREECYELPKMRC